MRKTGLERVIDMVDESKDTSNPPADKGADRDIVVVAPSHPVEGRSVEIGVDGKIGINVPCPIKKIGPVSLTCGTGFDTFDVRYYTQARATMPLSELVHTDVVRGFRLIAEMYGDVGPTGAGTAGFIGVASPPIHGLSIRVGVDPMSGKVGGGIVRRF